MASSTAASRRGNPAYQVKYALRAPLTWRRRRAARDEPPQAMRFLDGFHHSKAAAEIMALTAIDPHLIHRADLGSDSVVWDVGAAEGRGAADLRSLYDGEVHAFEPRPPALDALRQRFHGDAAVHPHGFGLGAADAKLPLELAGAGSSVHGPGGLPTVDVPIRDVAAVLEELGDRRIDLMKVNIEGGEYDLLERLLDQGVVGRFRYLLVQFHEWYPRAHSRRWRIRRRLRSTHDEVWCYPWIWELWCARDAPHPPSDVSPELEAAIRAEILAERDADRG